MAQPSAPLPASAAAERRPRETASADPNHAGSDLGLGRPLAPSEGPHLAAQVFGDSDEAVPQPRGADQRGIALLVNGASSGSEPQKPRILPDLLSVEREIMGARSHLRIP